MFFFSLNDEIGHLAKLRVSCISLTIFLVRTIASILGEDWKLEDAEHVEEGGGEGDGGEHLLHVAVGLLFVDRQVLLAFLHHNSDANSLFCC